MNERQSTDEKQSKNENSEKQSKKVVCYHLVIVICPKVITLNGLRKGLKFKCKPC